MRSMYRLSLPLFAMLAVLFSTGCGEDGPGPNNVVLGPVISLNSGSGLISTDQDLDLGTPSFTVSITANDGDAALRSLRVEENGTTIPFSRLTFDNGNLQANNPLLITGSDVSGFTYDIQIEGNPGVTGSATYSFVVTDQNNKSATETLTINYIQTGPLVELVIQDGLVSGDDTIRTFNGVFEVRMLSTPNPADLATLSVLEDGVLMDEANLGFNVGPNQITSQNPLMFAVGEMSQATSYRIQIRPDDVMDGESRTYTFEAEDVNGVSGSTSIEVKFETPPGTALTFNMTGVFFNASGSSDGGLDLDTGDAVPFNSDDAEIQDEGINLNIPVGTENWRAQISGANDAVVRTTNLTDLGDGVDFSNIATKEMVEMAFEGGNSLTGNDNFPNADGDTSNTEEVSEPVQVGDVFAVSRDGKFYLIRVDEVNYKANSNEDSYTVSIKY